MPLNPKHFWPPRNFGAIDAELAELESAKFVVLPVPYDSTTTWQGGTRDGANAILDASMNMELFDRELEREICEAGIHTTDDVEPVMSSPRDMARRVEDIVGEVLDMGKFPVMLGGEHSLTLGGVRALAQRSEHVTVVQIDAHSDLRFEYCGTPFGHGCVMRRCSELENVDIVQIGLRSTSREEWELKPENVTQFWADDILTDFKTNLPIILSHVQGDVYLTFDVDGCDPSWMPDTGTPEPGGFSFYQVRDLFRALCHKPDVTVRAFDCVELIGGNPASAFAVARLIYKVMGYVSQD
ncbi:N(1)-aminopropylagmatine ureohydrolase [Abditibacteriota bacterium]|nr:N(1)-aminopropylagmatine ureohydrolase [Abditibacteriota bacterium]